MQELLITLEQLGFYSYEDPNLVPIIQALQLSSHSIWIMDGKYDKLELPELLANIEPLEVLNEALYIYNPLPPHRCFSVDQEDLYEYPPGLFEDEYLSDSLKRCGVTIESIDEYEDSDGNLHIVTDIGDFLICPSEFRSSHNHNIKLGWKIVTAKSLMMLNSMLFQVGSSERFYVLHERSEELIVIVMLDPITLNLIQEKGESKDGWLPKTIENYFKIILSQM